MYVHVCMYVHVLCTWCLTPPCSQITLAREPSQLAVEYMSPEEVHFKRRKLRKVKKKKLRAEDLLPLAPEETSTAAADHQPARYTVQYSTCTYSRSPKKSVRTSQ